MAELVPPSQRYHAWVRGRLPVLAGQLDRLATDVRGSARDRAKIDWLTAHLTYEGLGAAYDAFGPLGVAIDRGFPAVEARLWGAGPVDQARPAVTQLQHDATTLTRQFPAVEIEPNDLPRRAHEIVENAIEFELTGTTDAASHTELATVAANLNGTTTVLGYLEPLLRTRFPGLTRTEADLSAARHLVQGYDHAGRWTPLPALSTTQREQLDAALEGLAEELSDVAAIGDVRLVPTP
jgi:iron uptake system component EfeO